MKKEHEEILKAITKFLEENPEQRFGQALFNLKINQHAEGGTPGNYRMRDIYSDYDSEILKRINATIKKEDIVHPLEAKVGTPNILWSQLRFDNDRIDQSLHVQIAQLISELKSERIKFQKGEIIKTDFHNSPEHYSLKSLNLLHNRIDDLKSVILKRQDFEMAGILRSYQRELEEFIRIKKETYLGAEYFSYNENEGNVIKYNLTLNPVKDTIMYWYVLPTNPKSIFALI